MNPMLDELRQEVAFDKYIMFLLGLGFTKADVVRLTGVSLQTVYTVINRNEDKLLEWGVDIPAAGVIEEEDEQSNRQSVPDGHTPSD